MGNESVEKVTEEGVPIVPSDTVFREKIMEGKTPEEAEEFALVAGEARANTYDGLIRHKLSLGWKKLMAWIGGLTATAMGAITIIGTDKINSFIESVLK